jgi:Zn-dependent protease/predicted transcriptional regulator
VQAQVKVGRVSGITIGLHYSWFIIAFLIAFSLAEHFHAVNPLWSEALVWTAAIVTAVLFFAALLLHELAHSLVAKARGLRVSAITLFALGGVSQIESEAPDARTEFWIAIVGPATSFAIGVVLLGIAWLFGARPGSEPNTPIIAVLLWLGYINFTLAIFNMIPGYPLDGGRVFRAVLWWITHSQERATRWASQVGQAVAFIFIFLGLIRVFHGQGINGLWIAFIGWFLLDASRASYAQVRIMAGLRNRRVADLMDRDCGTVEAHISLQDFVDQYLLRSGRRCYVVVRDGQVLGLITPNEVKAVARDLWAQTSVQSAMRALGQLRTVTPETPALEALEIMGREDINQLPVMSNGRLEGVLSRSHVLRVLQTHAELQRG